MVIPIGKPGKDKSEMTSYRPIALTSNMCKVMERMVTDRLTIIVESRNIVPFSPHGRGNPVYKGYYSVFHFFVYFSQRESR